MRAASGDSQERQERAARGVGQGWEGVSMREAGVRRISWVNLWGSWRSRRSQGTRMGKRGQAELGKRQQGRQARLSRGSGRAMPR